MSIKIEITIYKYLSNFNSTFLLPFSIYYYHNSDIDITKDILTVNIIYLNFFLLNIY